MSTVCHPKRVPQQSVGRGGHRDAESGKTGRVQLARHQDNTTHLLASAVSFFQSFLGCLRELNHSEDMFIRKHH